MRRRVGTEPCDLPYVCPIMQTDRRVPTIKMMLGPKSSFQRSWSGVLWRQWKQAIHPSYSLVLTLGQTTDPSPLKPELLTCPPWAVARTGFCFYHWLAESVFVPWGPCPFPAYKSLPLSDSGPGMCSGPFLVSMSGREDRS